MNWYDFVRLGFVLTCLTLAVWPGANNTDSPPTPKPAGSLDELTPGRFRDNPGPQAPDAWEAGICQLTNNVV